MTLAMRAPGQLLVQIDRLAHHPFEQEPVLDQPAAPSAKATGQVRFG